MRFSLVWFLALAGFTKVFAQAEYYPVEAGIWHLEVLPNGDLLTGDYDGNIALRNLESREISWVHAAGSFVFDLEAADLDQDGTIEALYTTADGELVVLDSKGQILWAFQSEHALFDVVAGNFAGDSQWEVACGGIDRYVRVFDLKGNLMGLAPEAERVVHRLAVGDLDGDAYDEILSIEARTMAHLMGFDSGRLKTIWKKPLNVPSSMIDWENPGAYFFPFSLIIENIDETARPEIIMGDTYFNKQAVMVSNHEGEPLWISDRLPAFERVDEAQIDFYSTAFVQVADLYPEIPGKEVVSVAGGMFRVWDNQGNLLGSKNGKVAFADFEINEGDILLASNPNGDNTLYRMPFNRHWEDAVDGLEFRGRIQEIKEQSESLLHRVMQIKPEKVSVPIYDITLGYRSIETNPEGYAQYRRQLDWFSEEFPYPNLRLTKSLKVMEEEPVLDENGQPWFPWRFNTDSLRGTQTVDEIIEKARWVQENEIPTKFVVGHSCMPAITLETAEKILQAAPEYCLGFITNEDERLDAIPRYFRHYFQGLADLCVQYGAKVCGTKNKGLWWLTSPADPWVYESLFEGGRHTVAMASTEDSNSRTPELNLMGRGGLWQAGLIQNNEVSTHADIFSFNRFHQWENIKVGHPYLRLLVSHTTLGMTWVNTRIREVLPVGDSYEFTSIGQESTQLFFHLLGKGLVRSPAPEDILGYSPIGIVVHKPSELFLRDAHNGHAPELWVGSEELQQAVLPHNGNLWGMTTTPEHALTRVLFNKERQFGYQVPPTPYGLVAFVPSQTVLENVEGVSEWWHTDGISIWKEEGPRLTGSAAAEQLLMEFKEAAERLPFRQLNPDQAVFMNTHRIGAGHYRLYLVDPGWLDPQDHLIEVKIQMSGQFTAKDLLTGDPFLIKDNSFSVPVHAGLFTIVDVVIVK